MISMLVVYKLSLMVVHIYRPSWRADGAWRMSNACMEGPHHMLLDMVLEPRMLNLNTISRIILRGLSKEATIDVHLEPDRA